MPEVQGLHQSPHLVAVPYVAALELRQGDAAKVNLVQYHADLHIALLLVVSVNCIR